MVCPPFLCGKAKPLGIAHMLCIDVKIYTAKMLRLSGHLVGTQIPKKVRI
jgi:hypothetical protein